MHVPYFHPHTVNQRKIEQELAAILAQAHALGVQFGQTMIERAVGSVGDGVGQRFLDKARAILGGVVDRVRELIGNVFGRGEGSVEDAVQSALDQLPELIAETEIPTEVESAVMDTLEQNNVILIEWIDNPGACQMCMDNAASSPINIGESWPSGHTQPPAHPRCRCNVAPVAVE